MEEELTTVVDDFGKRNLPAAFQPENDKNPEEVNPKPTWIDPPFAADEKQPQIEEGLYITPFENRVIILRNKFVQASRIIIPDKSQPKPTTGKVVGLGPGCPSYLHLGQVVVFSIYGGIPVNFKDGTEYLMMSPDEIYGQLNIEPDKVKDETA